MISVNEGKYFSILFFMVLYCFFLFIFFGGFLLFVSFFLILRPSKNCPEFSSKILNILKTALTSPCLWWSICPVSFLCRWIPKLRKSTTFPLNKTGKLQTQTFHSRESTSGHWGDTFPHKDSRICKQRPHFTLKTRKAQISDCTKCERATSLQTANGGRKR